MVDAGEGVLPVHPARPGNHGVARAAPASLPVLDMALESRPVGGGEFEWHGMQEEPAEAIPGEPSVLHELTQRTVGQVECTAHGPFKRRVPVKGVVKFVQVNDVGVLQIAGVQHVPAVQVDQQGAPFVREAGDLKGFDEQGDFDPVKDL